MMSSLASPWGESGIPDYVLDERRGRSMGPNDLKSRIMLINIDLRWDGGRRVVVGAVEVRQSWLIVRAFCPVA